MGILKALLVFLRAMLIPKLHMAIENLALRQQLAVCKQSVKRPKLRPRDRVFWVWISRYWCNWQSALIILQPETVIRWHRQGFKLYWRWKSRAGKPGRPPIERAIGSIRRECLNHMIVLGERHLKRILTNYFDYYHNARPHLSLDRNSPTPREVEPMSRGEVISTEQVGGLHHRYSRAA